MIRPFLLIAVVVHAIALTWGFNYPAPKFIIPGPELSIALAKSTAKQQTAHPLPQHFTDSATGNAVQNQSSKNRNNPHASSPHRNQQQPVTSDPFEASHLKTLLHSAIQEHFIYPPIARKNGWQGRVYIGLTISSLGKFHDIRVVKRSPYPILDNSAIDTLRRIGAVPTVHALLLDHGQNLVVPVSYRLTEEI